MDVWDNTTTGNGSLDESVKFLISTNGKLQVTGSDTLHLQIFARVTGQLKNLGSKVLQNSRGVNGSGSTDTLALLHRFLQETVNTTNGELLLVIAKKRAVLVKKCADVITLNFAQDVLTCNPALDERD